MFHPLYVVTSLTACLLLNRKSILYTPLCNFMYLRTVALDSTGVFALVSSNNPVRSAGHFCVVSFPVRKQVRSIQLIEFVFYLTFFLRVIIQLHLLRSLNSMFSCFFLVTVVSSLLSVNFVEYWQELRLTIPNAYSALQLYRPWPILNS